MVTWCPSLTTLKMSTATKNLLFRSLRNNFSNVQTYSKHLKDCQWLNTVRYPDWWAPPGIQTAYRCQLDMTCMSFYLVMTGICGNIPVTSEDFLKTSKHCWKCPQMFWRRLSTSETTLQDNNNLSCFDFVRTQKRIQSHHLPPFWIEFS